MICVKGSGWDMGTIEPAGLPAVRLAPLLKLRAREKLSDEDMVKFQRVNLIDPAAPNPSVETLLHAFLPHKFIDHTHSTAVLALTDQPDGEALCARSMASASAMCRTSCRVSGWRRRPRMCSTTDPSVEGLVLVKHGIFSFGADARQAYERMIELVSLAEERLAKTRKPAFVSAKLPARLAGVADIAPIMRGACSFPDSRTDGAWKRFVLEFRGNDAVMNFVNGAEVARYGQAGVVTPDHTIRIKNRPLVVPRPRRATSPISGVGPRRRRRLWRSLQELFRPQQCARRRHQDHARSVPRVMLVPGVGLFGLGRSRKDANIAADLAEAAIEMITDAEAIGRFEPLPRPTCSMSNTGRWSRPSSAAPKRCRWPGRSPSSPAPPAHRCCHRKSVRRGGRGSGAARRRRGRGAGKGKGDRRHGARASLRRHRCRLRQGRLREGGRSLRRRRYRGVECRRRLAGPDRRGRRGACCARVSSSISWPSERGAGRRARSCARRAPAAACLFNVSKQAVNPGPDFGPYGLPKAATLFLVRQYALDYGKEGIRANAVNADRIRSGLLTEEMIAQRSKARGLSEADYMRGNLLGREVAAEDVAQAFLAQALALKTTADVTTVDGGNIAAALR